MHHHGLSHVLDGFNGSFGRAILVVGTNARDSVPLISSQESITKLCFGENAMVM